MATFSRYPDEWYPVLRLLPPNPADEPDEPTAEFSDAEIADIERVQDEFNSWQLRIAERFGDGELYWDHRIVGGGV